jgi:hypothetical protein
MYLGTFLFSNAIGQQGVLYKNAGFEAAQHARSDHIPSGYVKIAIENDHL